MRLAILTRHGRSVLNGLGLVNGDPRNDRGLSSEGSAQATALGRQLAGLEIGLCVVSEFRRAQQTAELALGVRNVATVVDPGWNDVRIGELEGRTIAEYEDWKRARPRSVPFPGGESLDDTARRYAAALERLLGREEEVVLVVCHEIPVRYSVNAAGGSDGLDHPLHVVPNATPYLFDAAAVRRAIDRILLLTPEDRERA